MDSDIQIISPEYSPKNPISSNNNKKSKTNYIKIIIFSVIVFFCIINFTGALFIIQKISDLEVKFTKIFKETFNNIYYKAFNYNKEFNQIINSKYIEGQKFFFSNFYIFKNLEYERQIRNAKVDFNNKIYDMYIFKNSDAVSETIINSKRWEGYCTNKILEVLNYYSSKKNIKNEDMYILDIGANVGWYSYYLGKFGYKIISFEPSERNYYILRKTYCLNQEINITIINKGLYNEEKRCDYYEHVGNKGNGMVICDQKKDIPNYLEKKSEVILTKLSNYIAFLSTKNLAFIKIDAEGSEESAFLSGIELLTKYHVPFIFLEYCPNNLKLHNVDKKKFLEIFYNNGYKISLNNFLDKNYTSIDYLASKDDLINIYIIYEKFFE